MWNTSKNKAQELPSKTAWPNPVSVSIQELVAQNRYGRFVLRPGKIRSGQAGGYVSPFKGRGMEFVEARPYQPGDDIRHLDWRLTARLGKAHSKIFEEERERSVFLWLDLAPSMFFATRGAFKSVVAAHAAALMAWSGVHNGDRIGGLIFSGDDHLELRPRQGKDGALHYIRQLVNHPAWQDRGRSSSHGSKADHLIRLRRVTYPGSLIFLFSDMRNFSQRAEIQLGRLARQNDVVVCFIYDQLEAALPPPALYRVSDGNRTFTLDTADRGLRIGYEQDFTRRWAHMQGVCQRLGCLFLPLATHDDLLQSIQRGLWGVPPAQAKAGV